MMNTVLSLVFLLIIFLLIAPRQSCGSEEVTEAELEQKYESHGTCNAEGCPGSASCIRKDDTPTIQELTKLDILTKTGKTLRIKTRIGVDYGNVGTCLLNDDDGSVLQEIQHDYSLVEERLNNIFYRWVTGKNLRHGRKTNTWGRLIECLNFVELHSLADDIESLLCGPNEEGVMGDATEEQNVVIHDKEDRISKAEFSDESDECSRRSLMPVPSIVDKEQFEQVVYLVSAVCRLNKGIMTSSIAESDVIFNASIRLKSIMDRLKAGKIRAGVVGLTKAGKSTTLNALLGKQFLPGSVQPQTAKEVSIVHTADTDGDLYGFKDDRRDHLATGQPDIHDRLVKFNNASRKDLQTGYDKLFLYAPLHFLNDNIQLEGVQFELSDTPGLGEAGSEHFAIESELAVRDMCAFVVIMKLDFLKTKSESDLLMMLSALHPKLFTNLNRILILINAYELSHRDKSNHNLQADRIQGYVSNYLREPNVLGKVIPHEHIILFSALWGFRSRLWLDNPHFLLNDKDARNLYNEGLIELDRAGYDVQLLRGERNEDKVYKLSSLLEDFSHIKQIESNLTQMLRNHGATVLLESSIDDTLSVLDDIRTEISQMIVREDLLKKDKIVEKAGDLLTLYQNTVEKYMNVISELDDFTKVSSRATVAALADSLEDRLNSIVNNKLYETLQGTIEHEDKSHVQSRILSAKSSILSPSTTRMKMEWLQLTESLHRATLERVKAILSDLKIELASGFSDKAGQSSFSDQEMIKHTHQIATVISERLSGLHEIAVGFLPSSSDNGLQLELTYDGEGSERVADDALTQRYTQGKKTKYNLKSEKKCFGRRYVVVGPKDCVHYTVSQPYDAPTYSPDFVTIQSDFSEIVRGWIRSFKNEVNNYRRKICESVTSEFKRAVHSSLLLPTQLIEEDLQLKETALDKSKVNVDFLNSRKSKLNEAETELENLLTKV